MMRATTLFIFAALSLPLAIQPSAAAEQRGIGRRSHPGHGQIHRDGGSPHNIHRGFRGGDIRRFPEHDVGVWRNGHWVHGAHGGRRGWWWVAGDIWFFYPGPIYPYPDPYMPPLIEAPLDPGYWYYCDDPPGYYPYVAECHVPWHAVAPGDTSPPG